MDPLTSDGMWLSLLAAPWLGALAVACLPRRFDGSANTLAIATALVTTVLATAAVLGGRSGVVELVRSDWVAPLGLEFHLIRDGITDLFGITTAWITLLVVVYARAYLPRANEHEHSDRRESAFYTLILGFSGSMLATVSAGNALVLYGAWELTGLFSYLLIGYWRHLEQARRGALRALILTSAGGLALLLAAMWIGTGEGIWVVTNWRDADFGTMQTEILATLFIVAALAKSAQVPFSNWLPGAMLAPTPVSALLHSAALVALGVVLLARAFPLVHATSSWSLMLSLTGVVGAILGGILAARQRQLKALLAWSTVSMYAFMMIGLSLGSTTGLRAALYAFFVHAIIKAGLFLVAGTVTHLTGKKELEEVGGLAKSNRVFAVYAAILGLSLGGVPITGGFFYKEELIAAAKHEGAWLLVAAMFTGAAFSIIYMLRFLHEIFVSRGEPVAERLPWTMGIALAFASGLALFTGLFPEWMGPLGLESALAELTGATTELHVALELNPSFYTSLGVLSVAFVIWLAWTKNWLRRRWVARLPQTVAFGGRTATRLFHGAAATVLAWHHGDLSSYLRRQLLGFCAVAAVIFALAWPYLPEPEFSPTQGLSGSLVIVVTLTIVLALVNITRRDYVGFALTLTLLGFSLGGLFLLLHGPDVALAQILIEMLATLSVLLALRQGQHVAPREPLTDERRWAPQRTLIALAVAISAAGGSWLAMATPTSASVGAWYAEHIERHTGATAYVAAVLTEFRGLDTAMETLVFALAVWAVKGLYWKREVPS